MRSLDTGGESCYPLAMTALPMTYEALDDTVPLRCCYGALYLTNPLRRMVAVRMVDAEGTFTLPVFEYHRVYDGTGHFDEDQNFTQWVGLLPVLAQHPPTNCHYVAKVFAWAYATRRLTGSAIWHGLGKDLRSAIRTRLKEGPLWFPDHYTATSRPKIAVR